MVKKIFILIFAAVIILAFFFLNPYFISRSLFGVMDLNVSDVAKIEMQDSTYNTEAQMKAEEIQEFLKGFEDVKITKRFNQVANPGSSGMIIRLYNQDDQLMGTFTFSSDEMHVNDVIYTADRSFENVKTELIGKYETLLPQ